MDVHNVFIDGRSPLRVALNIAGNTLDTSHVAHGHDTVGFFSLINLNLCSSYYLVCHRLLHQVHLGLSDNLHQLVLKRDRKFVLSLALGIGGSRSALQLLDARGSSSLSNRCEVVLDGRVN